MTSKGTDVKTTVSDLTIDDTLCCSSVEYNAVERFLLSDPHIPMWKFIPPVIIVLGTFGNVMTIVMMRRMSEGQSSHTMSLYFTALAVSDLIILYSGLLRKWLYYLFNIFIPDMDISLCKLIPFLVYSSGTISAWIIVAMTMQRVMSVVWPHYKSLSCTKKKVGLVITIIVAVPFALNSYILSSFEVVTELNSTERSCYMANNQLYNFDFFIYPWIDLVVSSIIPFCILIVGNSVLVWKVIQSVHVARVMTAGGCDQVNSRQKKASSLTITLITVSLVFLLLSLPACIYLIIIPYINTDTDISLATVRFVWVVCNLAWYANGAINFYLYCLTGSRFRNEVKSLFCGRSSLKMSVVTSLHTNKTGFSKFDSQHNEEGGDF
ncbi:probable G-protein coupled receptor 139 [Pomacea canaliculata]|uniref:probable G-protein coupled receptor 139 n=1 Tax=Pomacea canaliculata TaxID=400727 RepID=UPI000D73B866|nr:probable G-protein coupled receptor 139 [Pomacea canaliculata]